MDIEKIIYETTRGIYSVEDKLSIATIFIFCEGFSSKLYADLLYTENIGEFIYNLNTLYAMYDVDFSINLKDKNIRDCFFRTREKVIEKENTGYYKALFNNDPYAKVIDDIVNYKFDEVKFKKLTNNIKGQLKMQF